MSVGAVDSFIGATDTLVVLVVYGFQWGFRGSRLLASVFAGSVSDRLQMSAGLTVCRLAVVKACSSECQAWH